MAHHRMLQKMRGSKTRLKVALASIVTLGWAMVFSTTVWADAAPPAHPPGSNIEPGGSTMVQMVAENVLLWLQKGEAMDVSVTADFVMRNQGSAGEALVVRFPMKSLDGREDENQVWDVSIQVDGKPITFEVVHEAYLEGDPPIPWATFQVEFPPGEDVFISVNYLTGYSGWYASDKASIKYILGTGSGWYGPIGSVAITLRLPYAASHITAVFLDIGDMKLALRDIQYVGNDVRWHAQNFEPDPYDEFHALIILPKQWKRVLDLEARVAEMPGDLEAMVALAEGYSKYVWFERELAPLGANLRLHENTILRGLALNPRAPELYAELAFNRWWQLMSESNFATENISHQQIQSVKQPLMIALKGDPDNPTALEVLRDMRWRLGDFELPEEVPDALSTYTPAPTVTATIAPTNTPIIVSTEQIFPTSTPQSTATKRAPTPMISAQPTLSPESGSEGSEGPNILGFLMVGLASLLAGVAIGHVVARRSD